MQNIFVNHLQLYSAKFLDYYVIIQADSQLTNKSTVPKTILLIFYFLWNIAH